MLLRRFERSEFDKLAWRDLRLSPDGVATLTAVAIADGDMGFCSLLIGADCHTGNVSCCYCLDEFISGALFDACRERVVTWAPHEAGFIAFHVFSLVNMDACCALMRRFTLSHVPGQRLQRIEWCGDRVILWVGDAADEWAVSAFDVRGGAGGACAAARTR